MRIVIETGDEGTVVKGAAAQRARRRGRARARAELAAAAAAIGAIDAGPGPTGPHRATSAPLRCRPPPSGPRRPCGTAA